MSTSGRLYTDGAVDRVLARWLSDGPTAMPDASLDAALLTVSVTRQRGGRSRVSRIVGAMPLVPVGLTLGVIAVVATLAIGLGQLLPLPGTEATPTPSVSSSSTPRPTSEPPLSLRMVPFAEAGLQIGLPDTWEAKDTGDPELIKFGGHGGQLSIRVGDLDGGIRLCGDSTTADCQTTVVDSLEGLVALVWVEPKRTGIVWGPGMRQASRRELSVGGEPAVRVTTETWPGSQPIKRHYILVIHEGRPYVMAWRPEGPSPSGALLRQILASISFLD